jgi:hypothetical protein
LRDRRIIRQRDRPSGYASRFSLGRFDKIPVLFDMREIDRHLALQNIGREGLGGKIFRNKGSGPFSGQVPVSKLGPQSTRAGRVAGFLFDSLGDIPRTVPV